MTACFPDAPKPATEAQLTAASQTTERARAVDIAAGQQDGSVGVLPDCVAEAVGAPEGKPLAETDLANCDH
ncbi:hypothetical protein CEY15_09695 [Dietzia natronolimnaea]|uniref:Uncharacterized protein n=1 Tax=Dietzia natronolimnaea TaxID=161920 RepID=A0A2A2WQ15_9ACTN|nr:hypothetical protein [Dietzia natronolimnaea]PAY23302.1 hypothetical protein CEY15_09695 [Dietzia natronolimnaea]